jgi:calcium-dependent protein kinase
MQKLDHPNILKVYEMFEDSKNFYIIEEFISGGELFGKVVDRGGLPEAEASYIMKQLLSCLTYCHKHGVMHRDLKPENIMVDMAQGYTLIKVIDWGSGTPSSFLIPS